MLSLILYAALAVVVAAVLVSVLVVVLPDDTVSVAARDRVPVGLPASGDVDAHDVDRVRLPVVVRGYRMVDTDAVLDRLSAEIDRRDQEIAALRAAGVVADQDSAVVGGQPAAPAGGAAVPAAEEPESLPSAQAAAEAQHPMASVAVRPLGVAQVSTAPSVDEPLVEPVAQPEIEQVPIQPRGEQPWPSPPSSRA